MKALTRIGFLLLLVGFSANAYAEEFTYIFELDGSQEVPPFVTPATGDGICVLNTNTNLFSWDISWANLLGTSTVAHFHGPALPGVTAPPTIDLGASPVSPLIGQQVLTDQQEADVLAGLWYVNIHSTAKTTGEIRGQVVPEPASLIGLGAGALMLLSRRRK